MAKMFSYLLEDTMGGTAMRLRPIFTTLCAFQSPARSLSLLFIYSFTCC